MAENQLPGNKLQDDLIKGAYLEGLVGSIAARILLICVLLLVVPLSIHTFLVYREDYRDGLKNIVLNLNTLAKAQGGLLNEFIANTISDLQTMDVLIQFPHAVSDENPAALQNVYQTLNAEFAEIAVDQGYTSCFYQTLDDKGDLTCVIAADTERIGKINVFKEQYDKVKSFGVYPYLAVDPIKKINTLFISRLVKNVQGSTVPGVLTVGFDAEALITRLQKAEGISYPLKLAFMTNESNFFVATDNSIINKPLLVFSLEDLSAIINNAYPSFGDTIKTLPNEGTIAARISIYGNAFYYLIGLPKQLIINYSTANLAHHIFRLTILFVLLGGGAVVLLVVRITQPLKDLAATMQNVAQGNLAARYTDDPMGFEINLLGKDFNHMVEALTFHMKEAKDQRLAKELLEQELGIGREIQRTILPREMPKIPGLELATGFIPAQEVAGDFFDIFLRKDGKFVFSIADASGKGISACLYSLCMRSMLRSYVFSYESLQQILQKTNEVFCLDTGQSGVFVTLWIGILDTKTYEFEYCSCGHLPCLLRHPDGTLEELNTSGMALGVDPDTQFQIKKRTLSADDILLLCTDGTIEAQNTEGEFFGPLRLKKVLQEYKGSNMSFFVSNLTKNIEQFSQGMTQFDDITIVTLKVATPDEMLKDTHQKLG